MCNIAVLCFAALLASIAHCSSGRVILDHNQATSYSYRVDKFHSQPAREVLLLFPLIDLERLYHHHLVLLHHSTLDCSNKAEEEKGKSEPEIMVEETHTETEPPPEVVTQTEPPTTKSPST